MPKTLSTDLREPIVRHVGEGHIRRGVAERFAVSEFCGTDRSPSWRDRNRGAEVGRVGRRSKLDAHRDYLVRRIAEAADITMPELAAELSARGVGIDPSNLSRWFIRNGYRFKKNAAGQRARSTRRQASAQ